MTTGLIRLSGQRAFKIRILNVPRRVCHIHGLILGRAFFTVPAFG